MFPWPRYELTDYERSIGIREYSEPKLDANGRQTGKWNPLFVRRRTYVARIGRASSEVGGTTLPPNSVWSNVTLSDQVRVSRQARVFGLTFIGNITNWRLRIRKSNGEEFTPTGADGLGPTVPSMLAGTGALVNVGLPTTIPILTAYGPLLIDPNWQMVPNEQLFFEGQVISTTGLNVDLLGIGVHVWELPTYDSDGVNG